MRIAIMSFAHLHAEGYVQNLRAIPGVELIGMADDDPARDAALIEEHYNPYAQGMTDLVAARMKQTGRAVILDVTGLRDIDTRVASALVDTAKALQLLGARTILTGIRPAVAQTLVGLGLDLAGILTKSTLQSAIAFALQSGQIAARAAAL